jgi:hypothetical protein
VGAIEVVSMREWWKRKRRSGHDGLHSKLLLAFRISETRILLIVDCHLIGGARLESKVLCRLLIRMLPLAKPKS